MKGVIRSSGNVFADVGLPDSDALIAKAELTRRISKAIEDLNLTQLQVAERIGIDQPKVSMLLRGHFEGFSLERLFKFLNALGQDVEIVTKPKGYERARIVVPTGGRSIVSNRNHYYVEQTADHRYAVRAKGSDRASEVLDTQREAIERARELNPNDHPDVERVRDTDRGGRDKWRKA